MTLKIGLALSGGGSKGAFSVGVLQTLRAALEIDEYAVVAGTSTGSLIGTMLASNDFTALVETYRNVTTKNIVNPNHALLASVLGDEAVLFSQALLGGRAIYNTKALRNTIEANLDYDAIQGSATTLLYSILDLQTGDLETVKAQGLSRKRLVDTVLASASMPVLMEPVDVQGGGVTHQWVDGGVREFLPLSAVFEHGPDLDHIIAISTAPLASRKKTRPFDEIMKVLVRTIDLYDTEIGRNDYYGALQFNALLTMLENAKAEGVSETKLKRGIPTAMWNRIQGKHSIPVTFIGPSTHLDFTSLHFDPPTMKAAMKRGQKAGKAALPRIEAQLP